MVKKPRPQSRSPERGSRQCAQGSRGPDVCVSGGGCPHICPSGPRACGGRGQPLPQPEPTVADSSPLQTFPETGQIVFNGTHLINHQPEKMTSPWTLGRYFSKRHCAPVPTQCPCEEPPSCGRRSRGRRDSPGGPPLHLRPCGGPHSTLQGTLPAPSPHPFSPNLPLPRLSPEHPQCIYAPHLSPPPKASAISTPTAQ